MLRTMRPSLVLLSALIPAFVAAQQCSSLSNDALSFDIYPSSEYPAGTYNFEGQLAPTQAEGECATTQATCVGLCYVDNISGSCTGTVFRDGVCTLLNSNGPSSEAFVDSIFVGDGVLTFRSFQESKCPGRPARSLASFQQVTTTDGTFTPVGRLGRSIRVFNCDTPVSDLCENQCISEGACIASLVVNGQCALLGGYPQDDDDPRTVQVGSGTLRFIRDGSVYSRADGSSSSQLLGGAPPACSTALDTPLANGACTCGPGRIPLDTYSYSCRPGPGAPYVAGGEPRLLDALTSTNGLALTFSPDPITGPYNLLTAMQCNALCSADSPRCVGFYLQPGETTNVCQKIGLAGSYDGPIPTGIFVADTASARKRAAAVSGSFLPGGILAGAVIGDPNDAPAPAPGNPGASQRASRMKLRQRHGAPW